MKVCLPMRTLLLGVLILPVITYGQKSDPIYGRRPDLSNRQQTNSGVSLSPGVASYRSGGEASSFTSNVPLNEINIKAFRYFHRQFPSATGESWIKSSEGLTVCFSEMTILYKAFFTRRGALLYSLKYYRGQELTTSLQNTIQTNYPGFVIGLVTEIKNGERTFYQIKIENSSFIKTLAVCDGKMEVSEELVNAGAFPETGNWAGLSY